MKLFKLTIIVSLILLMVGPASAGLFPMVAEMNGANANAGAGTGSEGTGTANISYDDVSKILSWSITWSGLTGTPTAMHFHGPALPNQNAGVQVGVGVVGTPVVGNAVLTLAQEVDLFAGMWYLNLHTTTSPGGEIRGTVGSVGVANEAASWGAIKAIFR
ncbi:MAG: CHRD domain-containing protein [Candidatus Krumholzibacteria bacterium]|nr:CHRD domain-containing protein [Candidatus Krumholzibacteria bacterium]